MTIIPTEQDIEKTDGTLTKLTNLIKKHWLILLIILLGYGGYRFVLLVGKEMDRNQHKIETRIDSTSDEPYVIKEYDERQPDGNMIRVVL